MKRNAFNLCVDLLAAVFLLSMVATGYILRFPLPPGSNRTRELWGLARHDWGTIHTWTSFGLLAVLLVHIFLHWKWIVSTIHRWRSSHHNSTPTRPVRAGLITGTAFLILGGFFAWATQIGVHERKVPLHPPDQSQASPPVTTIAPKPTPVSFTKDIKPIFSVSCLNCHGPDRASAHFRVDQKEGFFSSKNGSPLIVPGNPAASRLLAIVSGEVKDMKSASAHRLKPNEIMLIRTWISTGADWPAP